MPASWWASPQTRPSPRLRVSAVSVWKAQGHLELQANMWLGLGEGSRSRRTEPEGELQGSWEAWTLHPTSAPHLSSQEAGGIPGFPPPHVQLAACRGVHPELGPTLS